MPSIFALTLSALTALALDPHVEAVIQIVEGAKGKVEKTEDGQSLKLVDLAVPNTGPHDKRTEDPYDAAFFEHLGHITALESLNIISTKFSDAWMPSIATLKNLKTLRFTNNGKLTDVGLEKLAGLKNLETFSFVGTQITGKAYEKFDGFTKLTKVSHRGSSINDEGLAELCAHLPNLESLSLAHAKFTNAGAPHLAKLTKLKGLELGTPNATPACLGILKTLPLESLQLGEGFDQPESLANIRDLKTLKRLTLTNCAKTSDDDLSLIATMPQLESLELGNLPMTEKRIAALKPFAFLKALRLVQRPQPYSEDIQSKLKALLPKVQLTFQ